MFNPWQKLKFTGWATMRCAECGRRTNARDGYRREGKNGQPQFACSDCATKPHAEAGMKKFALPILCLGRGETNRTQLGVDFEVALSKEIPRGDSVHLQITLSRKQMAALARQYLVEVAAPANAKDARLICELADRYV